MKGTCIPGKWYRIGTVRSRKEGSNMTVISAGGPVVADGSRV